ncbi:MAG: short-chain dehydrogenase, partial [Rhodopila sp.]|nr:short-chain dehydrogenase [Rhodopila sp.]
QEIAERHAITHVVHNAGVIRAALLPEVTGDDLTALTQLHLNAALTLVQAALPSMRAAGFGRIVLISSRAALGLATRTAYSATKAGMIGMARTWALELASDGITVNVVAPGPIRETEMFHDVIPADSPREEALAAAIPVKRLGAPDDVAQAVMFFASPASSFITGQTLFVCGGSSIGSLAI